MILHLLRYLIVLILGSMLFYTYPITLSKTTLRQAIDRKLPMTIDKKGFHITINSMDIINVSNNVVESKIDADVGLSRKGKLGKFMPKKSIHLTLLSKATPHIHGTALSLDLFSIEAKGLLKIKEVKGVLKKSIEKIKIPLKKLKHKAWYLSLHEIRFLDDGGLEIWATPSRWMIFFLIPLFLLREIGLVLITLYQKFLSPRKKYKCAKGELYQNGTCSSTTKEAFRNGGFISGMKAYRASTKQCKKAYNKLKEKKDGDNGECVNALCSSCDIPFSAKRQGASASACDVGSLDCGAVPCEVGSC